MEKLLFFDVETTGVKHWENGIHQLSGAVIIDGKVKEKFNFKIKPDPSVKIEAQALEVSGITIADLANYPEQKEIYKKFTSLLSKYVDKYQKVDKFFLVGYNNAAFDNSFLRGFFDQCGDRFFGSYFWAGAIDVMVLALHKLRHERHLLANFKQGTVAKYLGIDVDESRLHDAEYDVWVLHEIYKKVSI